MSVEQESEQERAARESLMNAVDSIVGLQMRYMRAPEDSPQEALTQALISMAMTVSENFPEKQSQLILALANLVTLMRMGMTYDEARASMEP